MWFRSPSSSTFWAPDSKQGTVWEEEMRPASQKLAAGCIDQKYVYKNKRHLNSYELGSIDDCRILNAAMHRQFY